METAEKRSPYRQQCGNHSTCRSNQPAILMVESGEWPSGQARVRSLSHEREEVYAASEEQDPVYERVPDRERCVFLHVTLLQIGTARGLVCGSYAARYNLVYLNVLCISIMQLSVDAATGLIVVDSDIYSRMTHHVHVFVLSTLLGAISM